MSQRKTKSRKTTVPSGTRRVAKRPTAARSSSSGGSGNSRHGKSRPANLAQMHLAVLKHVERCRENGQDLALTEDAVRQIFQDQSGSKAHHAPLVRNLCEAKDPLRHILSASTACGAGTDASVFRPDADHFGVRMWPELRLKPILRELERLQHDWQHPEYQGDVTVERGPDPLEELRSSTGRSKTRYAPARPLW